MVTVTGPLLLLFEARFAVTLNFTVSGNVVLTCTLAALKLAVPALARITKSVVFAKSVYVDAVFKQPDKPSISKAGMSTVSIFWSLIFILISFDVKNFGDAGYGVHHTLVAG